MGFKSIAVKPYAAWIAAMIKKSQKKAVSDQLNIMQSLVTKAINTDYGKDHGFAEINSIKTFRNQIPIADYEGIKYYINKVVDGSANVLWPGRPKYLAKTSGTTSGIKYIPLTEDSMPNHMNTARNALMNYIAQSGNSHIFDGKLIFLSGSPILNKQKLIPTGRLSGIVNHEIPAWVKTNQLPSYHTNCIEEWEEKLEKVIDETILHDLRLISGIPPWVQMYYEKLLDRTGKSSIKEVFPNFTLFMYGGVNYEPYKAKLQELVGEKIDSIETYPASEGFIAFQDDLEDSGLLLNTNSGIFFEFIPLSELNNEIPNRLHLGEVLLGVDYVLIINNNAGLWGYNIGDLVRFTSLDPYKIVVAGRVKHFISAFGEHVIGKEVESAMIAVATQFHAKVIEFTVAPQVNPIDIEEPYHEWFVEFDRPPEKIEEFSRALDVEMQKQNIYYDDLIKGKVLSQLKIRLLKSGAFRDYMKSQGKLGGQNKVPRLSNDRKIADLLEKYSIL